MKWRTKRVKQGIVLYIAAEGQHGLKRRFKAWHEFHKLPFKKNIAIRKVPTRLCEPSAVNELMAYIKKILPEINPVLIVIDTLNKNFGSGDESKTQDMGNFVAGMDTLRNKTGACILALHHVGHSNKERGRGSIALFDGIDFEYRLEREGEPEKIDSLKTTMIPTKWKDTSQPDSISWNWNLQSLPWMELDDDDNLIPMNSIVLTPTDFAEPKQKAKPLGSKQRQAMECLRSVFNQFAENLVADDRDPDSARVTIKDWDEAMKAFEVDQGNRSRTRKSLIDSKLVCISDGYVKIVVS